MILTADIRSKLKPEHLYGKKGDVVSIIADHGNVVCVEGTDRNRFAVNKKYLDDYSATNNDVLDENKAVPDTTAPIIHKAPVSRSGKRPRAASLTNQTTIF